MPRSVFLLLHHQCRCLFVLCWLLTMSAIHPSSSFFAHVPDPVIGVFCLSSMPRSVLLLLLLQTCCLLVYFSVGCWQCLQFIHFPRFLFYSHLQGCSGNVVPIVIFSLSVLIVTSPFWSPACCCFTSFLLQSGTNHPCVEVLTIYYNLIVRIIAIYHAEQLH